MKIKGAFGIVLFIFIPFFLAAQQTANDTASLDELWEKAQANNTKLHADKLSVLQSRQHTESLKDEQLPEIGVNGVYERVSSMPQYENGIFHSPEFYPVIHQSYTLGAETSLNIYSGGTVKREIRSSKIDEDIAAQRLNLSVSEIRFQTAVNYLDIYRNLQYKAYVEQDIKEREQQLKQIQSLFSKGIVLKSDVLRAELNLSKQREALTQIENTITIANENLNQITGEEQNHITVPAIAKDSALFLDVLNDDGKDTSVHAFEYLILQKETEQDKLQLKQIKSRILPKVSLFGEYQDSYPQILFYPYADAIYGLGMAGIKASMSLSELYTNKKKRNEAQTKIQRRALETKDFEEKLRVQVSALEIRYKEALERVEIAKQHIETASEAYRITRNSYFAQLSLLTDLLDAETQLLQARLDYTTEQVNAKTIYYQLQKTTGDL